MAAEGGELAREGMACCVETFDVPDIGVCVRCWGDRGVCEMGGWRLRCMRVLRWTERGRVRLVRGSMWSVCGCFVVAAYDGW